MLGSSSSQFFMKAMGINTLTINAVVEDIRKILPAGPTEQEIKVKELAAHAQTKWQPILDQQIQWPKKGATCVHFLYDEMKDKITWFRASALVLQYFSSGFLLTVGLSSLVQVGMNVKKMSSKKSSQQAKQEAASQRMASPHTQNKKSSSSNRNKTTTLSREVGAVFFKFAYQMTYAYTMGRACYRNLRPLKFSLVTVLTSLATLPLLYQLVKDVMAYKKIIDTWLLTRNYLVLDAFQPEAVKNFSFKEGEDAALSPCSIKQSLPLFPVTAACKHIFELFEIYKWEGEDCPSCRQPLKLSALTFNDEVCTKVQGIYTQKKKGGLRIDAQKANSTKPIPAPSPTRPVPSIDTLASSDSPENAKPSAPTPGTASVVATIQPLEGSSLEDSPVLVDTLPEQQAATKET